MSREFAIAAAIAQLSSYSWKYIPSHFKAILADVILTHLPKEFIMQTTSIICSLLAQAKPIRFTFHNNGNKQLILTITDNFTDKFDILGVDSSMTAGFSNNLNNNSTPVPSVQNNNILNSQYLQTIQKLLKGAMVTEPNNTATTQSSLGTSLTNSMHLIEPEIPESNQASLLPFINGSKKNVLKSQVDLSKKIEQNKNMRLCQTQKIGKKFENKKVNLEKLICYGGDNSPMNSPSTVPSSLGNQFATLPASRDTSVDIESSTTALSVQKLQEILEPKNKDVDVKEGKEKSEKKDLDEVGDGMSIDQNLNIKLPTPNQETLLSIESESGSSIDQNPEYSDHQTTEKIKDEPKTTPNSSKTPTSNNQKPSKSLNLPTLPIWPDKKEEDKKQLDDQALKNKINLANLNNLINANNTNPNFKTAYHHPNIKTFQHPLKRDRREDDKNYDNLKIPKIPNAGIQLQNLNSPSLLNTRTTPTSFNTHPKQNLSGSSQKEVVPPPMNYCPYCSYSGNRLPEYDDHVKTHLPYNSYGCYLCTYESKGLKTMRNHVKKTHFTSFNKKLVRLLDQYTSLGYQSSYLPLEIPDELKQDQEEYHKLLLNQAKIAQGNSGSRITSNNGIMHYNNIDHKYIQNSLHTLPTLQNQTEEGDVSNLSHLFGRFSQVQPNASLPFTLNDTNVLNSNLINNSHMANSLTMGNSRNNLLLDKHKQGRKCSLPFFSDNNSRVVNLNNCLTIGKNYNAGNLNLNNFVQQKGLIPDGNLMHKVQTDNNFNLLSNIGRQIKSKSPAPDVSLGSTIRQLPIKTKESPIPDLNILNNIRQNQKPKSPQPDQTDKLSFEQRVMSTYVDSKRLKLDEQSTPTSFARFCQKSSSLNVAAAINNRRGSILSPSGEVCSGANEILRNAGFRNNQTPHRTVTSTIQSNSNEDLSSGKIIIKNDIADVTNSSEKTQDSILNTSIEENIKPTPQFNLNTIVKNEETEIE